VTCFFDPSHGPGSANVLWTPQWGVSRPIQSCGQCAQRVQTTAPPYYIPSGAPQAAGYPQQTGYPQQGYPPQAGYPQQGYPQSGYPPPQRHGHSTGAVVGAGVAGLVGGALLGEMLSNDEPREVVENNVYEDSDGSFDDPGGFDDGSDDNGDGFFSF
jgi:hypothetical protein